MIEQRGLPIDIQVDGNVSLENAVKMVRAGANWLVGGTSSLFATGVSIDEGMRRLRHAAQMGGALARTGHRQSSLMPRLAINMAAPAREPYYSKVSTTRVLCFIPIMKAVRDSKSTKTRK